MRELTNAELDAEVIALDARRKEPRIKLVPFDRIKLSADTLLRASFHILDSP